MLGKQPERNISGKISPALLEHHGDILASGSDYNSNQGYNDDVFLANERTPLLNNSSPPKIYVTGAVDRQNSLQGVVSC